MESHLQATERLRKEVSRGVDRPTGRLRKKVRDTEGSERPREKGSETQRDKERIS